MQPDNQICMCVKPKISQSVKNCIDKKKKSRNRQRYFTKCSIFFYSSVFTKKFTKSGTHTDKAINEKAKKW